MKTDTDDAHDRARDCCIEQAAAICKLHDRPNMRHPADGAPDACILDSIIEGALERYAGAKVMEAIGQVYAAICEECRDGHPVEFNRFLDGFWYHQRGSSWVKCEVTAHRTLAASQPARRL